MPSNSRTGLAGVLGWRFKSRFGSGCIWVPAVPGWSESRKPWAVPGLGHFFQPLSLVLMEGPSPAPQNLVGCSREFLGGCGWPKPLPHLLTSPLKHTAPQCSSELPDPPQKPLLSSSIPCYVRFPPTIFHPISVPLGGSSVPGAPAWVLRSAQGRALVTYQHLFPISSGTAGLWD